jgi:hypothetical protein
LPREHNKRFPETSARLVRESDILMGLLQSFVEAGLVDFTAVSESIEHFDNRRNPMAPAMNSLPARNPARRQRYDLLQTRAVTLARKQEYVAATRCFEVLTHPTLARIQLQSMPVSHDNSGYY